MKSRAPTPETAPAPERFFFRVGFPVDPADGDLYLGRSVRQLLPLFLLASCSVYSPETGAGAGRLPDAVAASSDRFRSLADAYLASGNRVAARRYYTLVTLLRSPGGDHKRGDPVVRACERLARIEIERGNHREAREWLAHLKDDSRDAATSGRVLLTEAMIALAERRVQEAYAILERLCADPDHDEPDLVLYEYSRACRESGRPAAARRALNAVLTKYPESQVSHRARAVLDH